MRLSLAEVKDDENELLRRYRWPLFGFVFEALKLELQTDLFKLGTHSRGEYACPETSP
jgi:hypothetical protein